MITGNYFSTNDGGVTWFTAPQWVETADGRVEQVKDKAARQEWADLIASTPPTYRQWKESGAAPLQYENPVIQSNPEPEDDIPVAAVYRTGTQAERDERQRSNLTQQIEAQRFNGEQPYIDRRRDPGLVAVADETEAAVDERLRALNATADADLGSFDPTLQPAAVGATATAGSLADQGQAILDDPNNGLTPQQETDLTVSVAAYSQIVTDGDDAAAVPEPPSFVRRAMGVIGEDYGIVVANRELSEGFWWLALELRIDRQLTPGDYWFAVYDQTGVDDVGDTTTGYLTTPQLTEIAPGVYRANRNAVNLPRNTPDDIFKFTLCFNHIDNPQFDKMTLGAGDTYERYRVRWGGNAGGGGGAWTDTGQTVDSIPYGNGLRIQDTTGFASGDELKMNDLEYEVDSVFNATDLILTVHPDNSVIGHSVLKRG